jgi:flagellar biogenesis protein FliO
MPSSIARLIALGLLIAAPGALAAQVMSVEQVANLPKPAEPPSDAGQVADLPNNRAVPPGVDAPAAESPVPLPVPPPSAKQPVPALPPPPARRDGQLPLGAGSRAARGEHSRVGNLPALATVGGSLAVVLGLFFIFAWAMRRAAPRGSAILPGEVFEVLGRAPLAGRQQVHLLRCGAKLLLVSITPAGTEALTEVTDPLEVDRLAGLCRQAHPHSATAAFRQVFQQLAPKRPGRGLLEESPDIGPRRERWEEDHV